MAPDSVLCPHCGGSTRVQKTAQHHVATLEHGPFTAKDTILVCRQRCTNAAGRLVTVRSEELRRKVHPGAVYGYDLEVRVGLERYLHHRQRMEIQHALAKQGVTLSTGQISVLASRFLEHLHRLHQERTPFLREAIAADGGYSLHIDATGEDGRGTMFVAYNGWRKWTLGAWKLSTERSELILPGLRQVAQDFGAPRAIMRDLGKAVIKAAKDLKDELDADFPILSCHQHFLGDIGQDLLEESHDKLRELVRRFGLKSALRKLSRDLGLRLGTQLPTLRPNIAEWTESGIDHILPASPTGLAIVRALAQWVLDYPQDSEYGAFPFDHPYLDFYHRGLKVRRSVDAFLRTPPQDAAVRRALDRLARILDPLVCEVPFATTATTLSRRAALFDELRDALRLTPRAQHAQPADGTSVETTVAELQDIQQALTELTASLRQRRPKRGPANDQRQAIDLILTHIERHGDSLWGHVIPVSNGTDMEVRIVARTNNNLEGFWHEMKHGERRRSGRKILTHDLECLPASAALAPNLTRPDYVQIVCGSLENLPQTFAALDMAKERGDDGLNQANGPGPEEPNVTSASLPRVDRPTVRAASFQRKIEAAARSRPPRYTPSTATGS